MPGGNQRPGVSGLSLAAAVCSIVTLQALVANYVFHLSGAQRVLWGGPWGSVLTLGPGVLGLAAAVPIAASRGRLGGGSACWGSSLRCWGCMPPSAGGRRRWGCWRAGLLTDLEGTATGSAAYGQGPPATRVMVAWIASR